MTPLCATKKWIAAMAMTIVLVGTVACTSSHSPVVSNETNTGVEPEQFSLVSKDGVEIACPKNWHSESQPDLVYCVSRSDYIRITVAVLSALPQNYYDGLVAQGTVTKTLVHGYPTYKNDYTYPYQNHQLITKCITVVQGSEACHIMILCDVNVLAIFEPTFEYVLNSLAFTSTAS